ncbi:MAG: quinone-dependent dihydroorotate dehydrogenase [Bacteroidota bacterium]|nr:quinone-dependent dihydroorotate dehydrogenase [Bacteroidota bacterium]
MYKLLRHILFWFDAEDVHYFSMNFLRIFCKFSFINNFLRNKFRPKEKALTRIFFGLTFSNPVGLAAGFDKNARYLRELSALGFGFIEIGTVTPLPQKGNPRPRLFRLPRDKALINRMGFNNEGAAIIAARLKTYREKNLQEQALRKNKTPETNDLIIGGNIGKNKNTLNEEAWKDYELSFKALHPYVDYFVVNVSSPNTPGLRDLQQKEALKKILTYLQQLNNLENIQRPLLLKISPDLSMNELDDILELAVEINLDGLVACNTTTSRELLQSSKYKITKAGAGGLSGQPLKDRSSTITKYIIEKTGSSIPVITSGGIFTGKDAVEKFEQGASLLQVWTGFVYEGPFIVKNICKALI